LEQVMASNPWTKSAAEAVKGQVDDYLLSKYGPRLDGDPFHDGFVKAGGRVGKSLGGFIGKRLGKIGESTGERAGSLAGAWVANGTYREHQLIKDIVTHPENWTVDAAGAIVPVYADPASLPDATDSKASNARPFFSPLEKGVGLVGSSLGPPPGSVFATPAWENPFGNGIGEWPSSIASAGPLYAPQQAGRPGGLPGALFENLRDNQRSAQGGPAQAAALSWPSQPPDWPQALQPPISDPQVSQAPQSDGGAPTDDLPLRRLGRRTYSLSDTSAFDRTPVAAVTQPSPDGSLSLTDAYLEYLRRLNAN
jgi:hypothetical protein